MQVSLRFTGAIASAVAGEVTRLDQHPEFSICEGGAYKAAWDRIGAQAGAAESPALNLCDAFARDCAVSDLAVRFGRRLVIAAVDASLIVERRGSLGRFNPAELRA